MKKEILLPEGEDVDIFRQNYEQEMMISLNGRKTKKCGGAVRPTSPKFLTEALHSRRR